MEPTYKSLSVLMAEYLHIVLLRGPFSQMFRLVLEHVFPLPSFYCPRCWEHCQ